MFAYINEPKDAILTRNRDQRSCQRAKSRCSCYSRISMGRTTASYKRSMVQQKETEFYMSSEYKESNGLLYLNGSKNYEPMSLFVCVLGKKSRDSPPSNST